MRSRAMSRCACIGMEIGKTFVLWFSCPPDTLVQGIIKSLATKPDDAYQKMIEAMVEVRTEVRIEATIEVVTEVTRCTAPRVSCGSAGARRLRAGGG